MEESFKGELMRVFIILNNLTKQLSGVQVSALNRLKLLKEYSALRVGILTVNYHKNQENIFQKFHNEYLGQEKSFGFYNLYSSILGRQEQYRHQGRSTIPTSYSSSFRVSETHERYYNEQDRLIMYVVFYSNGIKKDRIDYINYFSQGHKFQRVHYTQSGHLSHIQYLDKSGSIYREELIDVKGNPKIIHYFNKGKLTRIEINNDEGFLEEVFYNKNELLKWWFNHFLQEDDVLIFDGCTDWISLFKEIDKNLKLISVLHANHLMTGEIPEEGKFVSQKRYDLLSDPNFLDASVILTKKQYDDIANRLLIHCPLVQIPHSLTEPIKKIDFESRNFNKIMMVTRLSPEKNVADAIRIMSRVVDQNRELELHIYGVGPEKEKLRQLIINLKLSNNVFLQGFSWRIKEHLERACLSLVTSIRESFSLATLESLSCGVPVLAYDINYGPSELIEDQYNGYLVKVHDIEKAAILILNHFATRERMIEMAKNSYESALLYEPEKIAKRWIKLIDR